MQFWFNIDSLVLVLYALVLITVVLTALSGCGQTGPLYMPTEDVPKPPSAERASNVKPLNKDS